MSPIVDAEAYQRTASAAVPNTHTTETYAQATPSSASPASFLASRRALARTPQDVQNYVIDPVFLDEILSSAEWASGNDDSIEDGLLQPLPQMPALDAPLTVIPEDDREDQNSAEARDQLAPLAQATPTINIDLDRDIVSDFVSEDTWNGDDSQSTALLIPAYRSVPLRRASTIETTRSRGSVFGLAPLSRTLTSMSNWSTRLDRVRYWQYTLEEWSQKIRDSTSLRHAEIIKVDRYIQKSLVPHRFLVFELRRAQKPRDIFLRLDRRPVPGAAFILKLGVTPANDCALLAADEMRAIRGNTPPDISIVHEARLIFPQIPPPTLLDLETLLRMISRRMAKYSLSNQNCWFFCAVCLVKLMDAFNGTMIIGKLDHSGLPAESELRASVHATVFPTKLLRTISTTSSIWSIAVSPNGNRIVSGHSDNSIRLWETRTGAVVGKPLEGHTSWVTSVAFSPNGRWIISGSDDGTVRLWDAVARTAVGEPLRGHSEAVYSVAISPDGKRIASGSWDDTVRLWDRETGAAIGEPLRGHTGDVLSVAFSSDGQKVASGSDDKTIRLWDAMTGNAIRKPFIGHAYMVLSMAFSPDGRYIASGSWDNTVRIWNTTTGSEICSPLVGHTARVRSVAFSHDGQYIASGSYDATIRFWSAMTGLAVGEPLIGHTSSVESIAFFPDGHRIASCGGDDRTIRIWDVPF